MNYQLTCVCGHRFFVTEDQVTRQVTCPSCGRTLQPVVHAPPKNAPAPVTAAPIDGDNSLPTAAEATKRCPFCGEVILAIAKKCKHCGEFLDRPHPDQPATAADPNALALPAPATTPLISDTPPIFSLHVSQWDNFWKYIILLTITAVVSAVLIKGPAQIHEYMPIGIAGTVVLMGFIAWFFYMQVRNSRCFIRPTRIETETGILSKDLTQLELFRITDLDLKQSLLERMLGIGTLHITSNDPQNPTLILYQIPKARQVYKYLQDQIPIATKQRGAIFVEK